MDKENFDLIKSQLPKGYAKMIKERTGKSYSSIFKTFQRNSPLLVVEIIDAALILIKETKRKNEKRQKEIQRIAKSVK